MNKAERQLFDGFTFLLGLFLGGLAAAGLSLSARFMSSGSSSHAAMEHGAEMSDHDSGSALAPVGRVALLGDAELAAAAAAVVNTPAPVDTVLSGPQVFNEACYLCHAPPGVPGAPVLGDAGAWTPRVAQGIEVLQEHAVNGFQGAAGFMPAKGGRVDLSDDEVKSAVAYMIEQLQ